MNFSDYKVIISDSIAIMNEIFQKIKEVCISTYLRRKDKSLLLCLDMNMKETKIISRGCLEEKIV